ncbi:M15 family metallopeptidase [Aeromonas sp. HMWF016]|uniref:M15 family metallopeptidase n=1 Tax=Aeromonas sp. HMWF016 TaxID=2056852 RepID=UPI000D3D4412|nr:M15 family metallopeptidase [Aeromonas sp. HMWF016]PTT44813.1 peptidase M15 [Aeromonas sp. HMWF016]
MTWTFSARSERRLEGVHSDLIQVVRRALLLSPVDFIVLEGVRTPERQRELKAAGVTKTLNSRHITGHAVDLAPWLNNQIPWHDWHAFTMVANAMKLAAVELNILLTWGGEWQSLRDGPHFELPWEVYP